MKNLIIKFLINGVYMAGMSQIVNSYYNSETSGCSDTGKGEPRTTVEMKQQQTFVDWDFISTWYIDFYTPDYPIFFVFTE